MKECAVLVAAVMILAGTAVAHADECTSLALSYATNSSAMKATDLTALKRCVDVSLKERVATDKKSAPRDSRSVTPGTKRKPYDKY
jgi:hypothetical protein